MKSIHCNLKVFPVEYVDEVKKFFVENYRNRKFEEALYLFMKGKYYE